MDLPDPGLTWEVSGKTITIKSEKLARQVFLEVRAINGSFSDNFFDMAPGETRKIEFHGKAGEKHLSELLIIKSIYDTYN